MMIFSGRGTFVFLASILTATFLSDAAFAERLLSTSDSSSRGRKGKGSGDLIPTRVAEFDTVARESTKLQYFTTRRSGSFTDMARNAAGTLYAVQDSGGIATINESDGIATRVVQISDPVNPSYNVKVPALEFVGSTLYAIINRQDIRTAGPPSVLSGYVLVSVDLTTGQVTDHAVELGGRINGGGHGLAYDSSLGRLVHFYRAEDDDISSSDLVELIDVDGGTKETVPFDLKGQLPDGYTGVVSLGASEFLVFDSRNTYDFFTVAIYPFEEPPPEASGPEPTGYRFSSTRLVTMNDVDRIRGLALTEDGNNVVALDSGLLRDFSKQGVAGIDQPVEVTVGGFPAEFRSLATSPVTGRVYALTELEGEYDELFGPEGSGIGLYQIDRNGPESNEVTELDLEFFADGKVAYRYPESIAFDDRGRLYGFSRGNFSFHDEYLVEIDLRTGELKNPVQIDLPLGYGHQLEYNPEDGSFYVISFLEDESPPAEIETPAGILLAKVTRGGGVRMIPIEGDFMEMNPSSFVFVGQGTFHFTQEDLYSGGNFLYSLNTRGALTLLQGPVVASFGGPELPIFGLARVGTLARADLAVGEKRSRLRGNNTFSRSGSGQKVKITRRVKRFKLNFFAAVENDGAYPGVISLKGTRAKGQDKIRYTLNGRNVTGAITRGLKFTLESGEKANVKASLSSRSRNRRWVSTNRISATYGSAVDTGVVKSTLIRKVKSSSRKPSSLF